MAFVQSEDQDNISLTSTFNTTLGSITNSKSPLTSNIHWHYYTRKPNKLERKGKAKIYYYKYCKLGSSILTIELQSYICIKYKDIQLEGAWPTLVVASII